MEHEVEHVTGQIHERAFHAPSHNTWDWGIFTVHDNTLITTWIVMGILIILALWLSKEIKKKPQERQVIAEAIVEFIENTVKSQIPEKDILKYIPLIGTIFLFVLFSNWFGLLPLKWLEEFFHIELASATNDLNTTAGLALISLFSYFYYGIKKKGLGYFKHYITPNPLFLPLNIMEDFTRPLSLAFRLFGNVLGGEIVVGILLFLTAPLIIFGFLPLLMMCLEVFIGAIQAFIFAILTSFYIGSAVAEHH